MQALEDVELTWLERATQQARQEHRQEGHQEGRQEGRQEGQHEGIRTLILLLLTWKFGLLPQDFVDQLKTISDPARLTEISRQLLTARTLALITLSAEQ